MFSISTESTKTATSDNNNTIHHNNNTIHHNNNTIHYNSNTIHHNNIPTTTKYLNNIPNSPPTRTKQCGSQTKKRGRFCQTNMKWQVTIKH